MSKSRWIIAAALGLIATLGTAQDQSATENQPSQSESPANGQSDREQDQAQPIDPTPALESIERAIRDLVAEQDEVAEKATQEREQRDLNAQEEMAHWSYWMTIATIGGVFATFVGLALIARTLHHTKRAADYTEGMLQEAKATTAAAKNTIKVTRLMGEAQTRAYITISRVKGWIGPDGKPTIEVELLNSGISPAFDVVWRGKCEFIVPPLTSHDFDHKDPNAASKLREITAPKPIATDLRGTEPTDIAAGERYERAMHFDTIDAAQIKTLTDNFSTFYITVEVEYSTVFGPANPEHKTFWLSTHAGNEWAEPSLFKRVFKEMLRN